MIKSMTAYAETSNIEHCIRCDVEIRSYNSRHLDIALYLPRSFSRYEEGIKKMISSKLSRGRIEIRISIEDQSEDAAQFQVDLPRAQAYYKALCQLKDQFSLESAISIEHILDGKEMIRPAEKHMDDDAVVWGAISKAVSCALDNLEAMRASEGDNLAKDLAERMDYIEDALSKVEHEATSLPQIYKDRLMERISVLMTTNGTKHGITAGHGSQNIEHLIDTVRLSQEAAILADKSDISEEIVRARSHIALFRDIISSPEPGGRKLNFLIQEFNREFNTMGSKSGRAELSHMIVDLKSELEKIREQIQNIE
ncbi:MAG: YicC family protein [Desulfamplus sp.]|nr:YicC family protein [Desulfamplus sp.]